MELHELSPVAGAKKKRKRIGFGLGSGHGKTACRGHKGQKARAGCTIGLNFEGGQMPLARRMPKRGFSNFRFAKNYQTVNISALEERFEAGSVVDAQALYERRLVSHVMAPCKILGQGELTKSLTVRVQAFSASAAQKINAAGGKAEVITGA